MSGKDTRERLTATPAAIVKKRKPISMIGLLLPHWKGFSLGAAAVSGEALSSLLQPWPLKIVVDLVGSKPMPAWVAAWVSAMFGTDKVAVLNFVALTVIVIAVMDAMCSYVESLSM